MADESVLLNEGELNGVPLEDLAASEVDIFMGSFVEPGGSDDVQKVSSEAATGNGYMVGRPIDPSVGKDEDVTQDQTGETIRVYRLPVGARIDARLAAGSDLTTAANANVSDGDLLVETTTGALANFDSAETSGSPEGAVYRALEAKDNSGASAGADNQVYIEARRIA